MSAMTTITPTALADLRAKAEGYREAYNARFPNYTGLKYPEDGAYLRAINPTTILTILDALTEARDAIGTTMDEGISSVAACYRAIGEKDAELATLRAELTKAQGEVDAQISENARLLRALELNLGKRGRITRERQAAEIATLRAEVERLEDRLIQVRQESATKAEEIYICAVTERDALRADNERLRSALHKAARAMECRSSGTGVHYCPSCDNTSWDAQQNALAAITPPETTT